MPTKSSGYAVLKQCAELQPFQFERREVGINDIYIEILFCGVCHSDLSMVDNVWGYSSYPMVPGHEIIGRVSQVGAEVTKFCVGDLAGIGTIVDSCGHCANCDDELEQYCYEMPTQTYSSPDRETEGITLGGYSNNYVVDQRFAFNIPDSLDPAGAAPLLCAGITTYSPLRRWGVGDGSRVGVVGLGGLGHLAIKIAKAMGANVSVFTTSPNKKDDALKMGADQVITSTNEDEMVRHAGSFDFILDTVSAAHDINSYLNLLKTHAAMCMVGLPGEPLQLMGHSLANGGKSLSGSGVGGMAETQEMLNFCGKHGIAAEIETIPLASINTAFDRLKRNDVKYRFVIEM